MNADTSEHLDAGNLARQRGDRREAVEARNVVCVPVDPDNGHAAVSNGFCRRGDQTLGNSSEWLNTTRGVPRTRVRSRR